jgi:hypothetical protein
MLEPEASPCRARHRSSVDGDVRARRLKDARARPPLLGTEAARHAMVHPLVDREGEAGFAGRTGPADGLGRLARLLTLGEPVHPRSVSTGGIRPPGGRALPASPVQPASLSLQFCLQPPVGRSYSGSVILTAKATPGWREGSSGPRPRRSRLAGEASGARPPWPTGAVPSDCCRLRSGRDVVHPGAPGAPGGPSSGAPVVDVVPTTFAVVVVELTAVDVVAAASVVFVVAGAVVSVGLAVVSVGLVVARVAKVVVVATRDTVPAVLEVCGVMTEGVEVSVVLVVKLVSVLVVVLGRVVVVTSTRPATDTSRGGRPRVTSTSRSARESKANPYSTTLTR